MNQTPPRLDAQLYPVAAQVDESPHPRGPGEALADRIAPGLPGGHLCQVEKGAHWQPARLWPPRFWWLLPV